jgi:hypothetical protein
MNIKQLKQLIKESVQEVIRETRQFEQEDSGYDYMDSEDPWASLEQDELRDAAKWIEMQDQKRQKSREDALKNMDSSEETDETDDAEAPYLRTDLKNRGGDRVVRPRRFEPKPKGNLGRNFKGSSKLRDMEPINESKKIYKQDSKNKNLFKL